MATLEKTLFEQVENIQTSQNWIESLKREIAKTQEAIKANLSIEFTNKLEILKTAIQQAFPTAKLTPSTLGFTVKSPAFKEYSKTEIIKMVNRSAEINIAKGNTDNADYYQSEQYCHRYKSFDIVLTKEYMRKTKPQLKKVFDIVDC